MKKDVKHIEKGSERSEGGGDVETLLLSFTFEEFLYVMRLGIDKGKNILYSLCKRLHIYRVEFQGGEYL